MRTTSRILTIVSLSFILLFACSARGNPKLPVEIPEGTPIQKMPEVETPQELPVISDDQFLYSPDNTYYDEDDGTVYILIENQEYCLMEDGTSWKRIGEEWEPFVERDPLIIERLLYAREKLRS